ncbi:MAG: DUF481 domain-containing protein [Alphaproteobacteria bacterium]|nr:DUF481 domain-containing protein [Alphaproteobacteria bacterium]MCB9695924.1 DUF481 domain-containing protein [Alphaproteobacteria bacterium]
MVVWAALAGAAWAQVNAETLAPDAEAPGLGLGWRGSFNLAYGNADLVDVGNDLSTQWTDGFAAPPDDGRYWFRDRVLLYGHQLDRWVTGDVVLAERFVHLRYTRMLVPRFGLDVFGQAGNDVSLLLLARVVGGGGVRVVAIRSDTFELWGGTGAMAEWEHRDVPEAEEPYMLNPRSTTYVTIRWDVVPDRFVVGGTGYLQPRFDDPADVQILEESRADVKLTDALSVGMAFRLRYDSRPPGELEPLDIRWSNTATLKLQTKPKE